MRADFDASRDVWGPVLALQLRAYAETTFKSASLLRALGIFRPEQVGVPSTRRRLVGHGPWVTKQGPRLQLLDHEPPGYQRLRYFDCVASDYQSVVAPYSNALRAELLAELNPILVPNARILDVGCGPGTDVLALAELVPDGEVVGCDLSRAMLDLAHANALHTHCQNVAFIQCDAEGLPEQWTGVFDCVLCTLSFQFFLDGEAVALNFRRVLARGGLLVIVDPGPAWFTALAEPLVRLAVPAFVRYRNGQEFCELLRRAGFRAPYWREVLPGIGLVTARQLGDRRA